MSDQDSEDPDLRYFEDHLDQPLTAAFRDAVNHVLEQRPAYPTQEAAFRILDNSATDSTDVDQLRAILRRAQDLVNSSRAALSASLPTPTVKVRADYLETLEETIGPKPADRTWESEWVSLRVESHRMDPGKDVDPNWSDAELETFVRNHNTLEQFLAKFRQDPMDTLVQRGWPKAAARTYSILSVCTGPIARALRDRDPCYAASTFALCHALYDGHTNELPPMLYRHIHGKFSLENTSPRWQQLLTPDDPLFCGLVSNGITVGDCDPQNFSPDGYMRRHQQGKDVKYYLEDSDIVGFVSAPADELGAHSAVLTYSGYTGAFPPKTLFRLQRIIPPGEWEAPGGINPRQRLLVVTATFMPPNRSKNDVGTGGPDGKLCASVTTLSYGSRRDFIRGLDDVTAQPVLTMEHEFSRQHTWKDKRGVEYSLQSEWAYVNGPAKSTKGCTPGTRDMGNDGKTPTSFLADINAFIRERCAARKGMRTELMELILEEVLAIRLYSGPAYQPINDFLRQVSKLSGAFRQELIQHPLLTFSETVRLICSGIQKLSAMATDEEASRPLWRAVRGELPKGFWIPDEQGMVCAVDMAFVSTSKNRQTPIEYMGDGKNVLWELAPVGQSDGALHIGADISTLSQFSAEEEMYLALRRTRTLACKLLQALMPDLPGACRPRRRSLFPPYTMLQVLEADDNSPRTRTASMNAAGAHRWDAGWETAGNPELERSFLMIKVRPRF